MRAAYVILLSIAGVLVAGGGLLRSSASVRAESPTLEPLPVATGELVTQGEEAPYRLFMPAAATDTKWSYYETLDPDEPDIERNDIEAIRIAVSDSRINVSLYSASPDGFSFEENNLGWTGRVTMNLVGIEPDGTMAASVDVLVTGPKIRIRTVEPPHFQVVFVPWGGDGKAIRFSLSRDIFAGLETVAYGALGYDATDGSSPFCETDECQPVFDGAPDGILDDFSNAATFTP